jgi:hypothetical protein
VLEQVMMSRDSRLYRVIDLFDVNRIVITLRIGRSAGSDHEEV